MPPLFLRGSLGWCLWGSPLGGAVAGASVCLSVPPPTCMTPPPYWGGSALRPPSMCLLWGRGQGLCHCPPLAWGVDSGCHPLIFGGGSRMPPLALEADGGVPITAPPPPPFWEDFGCPPTSRGGAGGLHCCPPTPGGLDAPPSFLGVSPLPPPDSGVFLGIWGEGGSGCLFLPPPRRGSECVPPPVLGCPPPRGCFECPPPPLTYPPVPPPDPVPEGQGTPPAWALLPGCAGAEGPGRGGGAGGRHPLLLPAGLRHRR